MEFLGNVVYQVNVAPVKKLGNNLDSHCTMNLEIGSRVDWPYSPENKEKSGILYPLGYGFSLSIISG